MVADRGTRRFRSPAPADQLATEALAARGAETRPPLALPSTPRDGSHQRTSRLSEPAISMPHAGTVRRLQVGSLAAGPCFCHHRSLSEEGNDTPRALTHLAFGILFGNLDSPRS